MTAYTAMTTGILLYIISLFALLTALTIASRYSVKMARDTSYINNARPNYNPQLVL
jgi:uncharacterized membrane protein required for colicin V production